MLEWILSSVTCFFAIWTFLTLQPHVHGWNSSLSLTWGWCKVILSLLKWYKPNMSKPTSSSLWYFGIVYLSQEKTITYYPEGYSFLLFVVGVGVGGVTRGRKMVKQRLGAWMLTLSIFPKSNKSFSSKWRLNLIVSIKLSQPEQQR